MQKLQINGNLSEYIDGSKRTCVEKGLCQCYRWQEPTSYQPDPISMSQDPLLAFYIGATGVVTPNCITSMCISLYNHTPVCT